MLPACSWEPKLRPPCSYAACSDCSCVSWPKPPSLGAGRASPSAEPSSRCTIARRTYVHSVWTSVLWVSYSSPWGKILLHTDRNFLVRDVSRRDRGCSYWQREANAGARRPRADAAALALPRGMRCQSRGLPRFSRPCIGDVPRGGSDLRSRDRTHTECAGLTSSMPTTTFIPFRSATVRNPSSNFARGTTWLINFLTLILPRTRRFTAASKCA